MTEIPLTAEYPYYHFDIALDSRTYEMRFMWNDRLQSWYLTLLADTGEILFSSIRLTVGDLLLDCHKSTELFSGDIMLVPVVEGEIATRYNLGTDVKLLYFTEEEINAV